MESTKLGDWAGTILWSPKGDRFVVVDDGGVQIGERSVWYVEVISKTAFDVGPHEVMAGPPAWSPTGTVIAMVRWYDDPWPCASTGTALHLDIVHQQTTRSPLHA